MGTTQGIHQDIAGRVLVVTIDKPEVKNAFDRETIGALRDMFEAVAYRDPLPVDPGKAGLPDGDQDIGYGGRYRPHVIVLRATGDVFCSGAHLGEMKELGQADYQENMTAALDMGAMFRSVRNCPAPVVARVQGPAFGGGVGLLAACDVVVSAFRARFSFSEVRLGLVPGVIAPMVIDRIGQAAARHYFLTAEVIDGAEAHRIGLVDKLAADGELDVLVEATVRSLLRGGAETLGKCKSLLEGVESLGFARSGELAARMIAEARTGSEAQAALESFLAKEPSPWAIDVNWSLPNSESGDR
ncbi:MAG: enoyl-CoA hydratase-related protein [Candidatus Krumholzibacteriota bacterium]